MSGEAKQGENGNDLTQSNQNATAVAVQVQRAGPVAITESGDSTRKGTIADLTRAQRRVLTVLCDPQNHDKTHEAMIALANVSKSVYWRALRDPEITRLHRETIQIAANAGIAAIVHKSLQVAISRDRDGFNDRKLLLEMSGHYTPKQQVEHSGGAIVGVVGVAMDAL